MKKITEITTEREFVSKLRTYYRKARRKGYQRNEISFLGLMEYTGSATREFEYQSDKYFSLGIRAYDWQYGNSLLSALIDKWENEIEAEKRKKQPTQPPETPQISTEAAETVNVSVEGEKEAERAENKPKRKIQYFHYTPEQLKRYIIDVYEKRANGEWILLPYRQIDTDKCFWDVINGKIGEWDRLQERFLEVNMDFNSPTCGRCFKINRTYQQDYFIVSNEKLLEFTINGNYYYIQKQTYSKGKHKWCYTIMDAHGDFAVDDFSYTKRGIMQRFNKWWKKNATIIWQASETPTQPPQSPETPQTVECTADTPKPRETARKPQNRAIGSAQHRQHSALGANAYAVLNDASATMAAMNVRCDTLRDTLHSVTYVPRECSTANSPPYW